MHNKIILLIFVVATSFQIACGQELEIGNGSSVEVTVTHISKFPYFVSIHLDEALVCGGAIIGVRKILTAASCMQNTGDVFNFTVRVGSDRYDEGGEIYRLSKVIDHPEYVKGYNPYIYRSYDVSLVILEEPIRFSENVSIIGLPNKYTTVPIKSMVTILGWAESSGTRVFSFHLVEIIPTIKCGIRKTMDLVCVYGNRSNLCQATSGVPLVLNGQLAGIATYASRICSMEGYATVYSIVTSFVNWIQSTI